jgi:single-stranded DNA-binding protein
MTINRVILVGNVAGEPHVDTTARPTTRLRVTTTVDPDTAEQHTISVRGRLGEICALYCRDGVRIYLEGRLHTRADGTAEIRAETVKILQPRPKPGQ